jgi:8-oxo-dGTP pyrophosphatase MutT (NUDIX family)
LVDVGRPEKGNRGESKGAPPIRNQYEVSAGGVIARGAGTSAEIVLIRPAGKNTWALPKGHIEKGESPAAAAERECREETGLEVALQEPLGVISYVYSERARDGTLTRIFKRVHFFLMRAQGGDISAHDDEIDEVQWLPLADALARATHKTEREIIEKARAVIER